MEYRIIEELRDLEQATDLEISIWGLDPRDAAPINLMHVLSYNGGLVLAAYDANHLVGISLAFPARLPDHRVILWSHMTGVHRDYQGQNIGFELKLRQREWALDNGYDQIGWTFDPLQRGNANFNLHRLGAVANVYHENFYGVMQDEINQGGMPSDRVEALWNIRDLHVEARLAGNFADQPSPDIHYMLRDQSSPILSPMDDTLPEILVQIPHNLAKLPNFAARLAWRLALREALGTAFAHGYRAIDFTSTNAFRLSRS